MPDSHQPDWPIPFGISAETGNPLPSLEPADLRARLVSSELLPLLDVVRARAAPEAVRFVTTSDTDPNNLVESGWGVIFAPGTSTSVKEALHKLLEKRRADTGGRLFKVFENDSAPQPGESATDWLDRHHVGLNMVVPEDGIPFYLLLVSSPEEIPFEFQYTLDLYWAVGRVHFDTPEEYGRYARSVVAYETEKVLLQQRRVGIFATRHDFDRATQLFSDEVAMPLSQGAGGGIHPLGSKQQFKLETFIGESATKENLVQLMQNPPALLFSGSHGMEFRVDDLRLPATQGALVCQDWKGYGSVQGSDWFAAADVPAEARLHGLIHFVFACYGAGCPKFDDFKRLAPHPRQIAPHAMIAPLPKSMLAHSEGGALATLGHIDRAWGYSFMSGKGRRQVQGFYDVLSQVLRGVRLGQATDAFNVRWAVLSTELSEAMLRHKNQQITDKELANAWVARDDARNYVIFGDPAVRLRVEDLPTIA